MMKNYFIFSLRQIYFFILQLKFQFQNNINIEKSLSPLTLMVTFSYLSAVILSELNLIFFHEATPGKISF